MPSVPESPCRSCGQLISLDRDTCPYCGTPIECYWFDDLGEIRSAVPFFKEGKEYIWIDGEIMPLDDASQISSALRRCLCSREGLGSGGILSGLLRQISALLS